ncbi:hypothetical protein PPM_p0205 (plasmid) [Paenibacillus polymyxa M1]|uniref:hypothetical protein n=1 Tax=Paenibacillus polymyxa TaxID=1406 RepID=UPI00021BBBB9|nr:hypothetical protein [Paenibacillus polymyxa]CCC86355.1 hypothetical protein PPM_p0205 [Paenibacillus polymyxa M1]
MELLIIILVFIIPIIVGFCSGFLTNTMTVDRSEIIQELDISNEDVCRPTPLTQESQESNGQSPLPEISSLPPAVEHSLSQLLKELANDQSVQEDQINVEPESQRFLAPPSDSDIPPTLLDNQSNEEVYETPPLKLPADEYNAIGRFYGYDFADQVTTTPELGPSLNEVDIMMGRLNYQTTDCQLTYNRKSVFLKGESIKREMDGEVVMVKGFFLDSELFFVQETDRIERSKQELDLQYGS